MLMSIITFLVYAFVLVFIADVVLYIAVKIKEKKKKKEQIAGENNETTTYLYDKKKKDANVPS